MKKLRNFFREKKIEFNKRYNAALSKDEKIYEVRLWGIEGESFNSDESNAWRVIKEIHQEILFDDENWHFFYENWYNIIRCSACFYPKLIEKLDSLDIYYIEMGEWVDEQLSTREHQKIYQGMFHCFTLMALKEYDSKDINDIYDRVSHCFFNHQFYVLEDVRKEYGKHWEAHLMSETMINRADYTSYCASKGIDASKSNVVDTSKVPLKEQVQKAFGKSSSKEGE